MSQQFENWRKASYSGNGGNCVEVATAAATVGVRDSKDKAGPVLSFSAEDWSAFLTLVR
jgi:hypothetical protein